VKDKEAQACCGGRVRNTDRAGQEKEQQKAHEKCGVEDACKTRGMGDTLHFGNFVGEQVIASDVSNAFFPWTSLANFK
jgi:hypothetical protein